MTPAIRRLTRLAAGSCALWLTYSTEAAAHRLDEYLQATRIAIAAGGVNVEIDLTAGAAIAPDVFAAIDADGDGRISRAEREAYATLVVSSAVLEIDGRREPLAVTGSQFPSWQEMSAGLGTIRLQAVGKGRAETGGAHQLYFRNTHRADASVYLVNALVPANGIQITQQRRDTGQHELWLDYRVGSTSPFGWARAWRVIGGLGLVALIACMRGRFRRTATTAGLARQG